MVTLVLNRFNKIDYPSWRTVLPAFVGACLLLIGISLFARQANADKTTIAGVQVNAVARLSTNAHGVRGRARVVDAQTIVLENFYYDGGGPLVYVWLATADNASALANGVRVGAKLNRSSSYANESVTITLPGNVSLASFSAIAIWCEDFKINFGSGTFRQEVYLPLLAH